MSLGLNQPYPQTLTHPTPPSQSKKIFCAYHRTQFLTNFCLQSTFPHHIEQCLMPLCPSCVAQHTEQHYQSSQKPTYINLNQALHQVKQRCYANVVSLQECNKRNEEIIRYRENLECNVREQLGECKQEIYVKIQQLFQKYQQKILKQIMQKYQEHTLYQSQQSDTIKQYISQQIQILYDKISLLKSDQCLAGLIRFYDHQQQDYQDGLKDVNQYLEKHRKIGYVSIKLGVDAMNLKLDGLCEGLLSLGYVSDEDKEEYKQNIRSSKLRKNPSTNLVTMTPMQKQKQNRPLTVSNNKQQSTPVNNYQSKDKDKQKEKDKRQNIY